MIENHLRDKLEKNMQPLKKLLKVGAILGEGIRAYTIEKITTEAIYLRGHPDAQRGEK